jgi:hypothetical protein
MFNDLVRRVTSGDRFDFILPLDADEFIVADDRSVLEAELETVRRGGSLTVNWLAYVPTEHDNQADPNPVTRIRRRKCTIHPVHKAFFATDALTDDDIYLSDGNHDLLSRSYREVFNRRSERIFLAHFPIRSPPQLVSKVIIGSAARRLSPDFSEHQSKHWRALLGSPSTNLEMPMEQLSQYAIVYLDDEEQTLIDAPLETSVKELTYPDLAKVDVFQRVSEFISALVSYRVLRGGGGGDVASQAEHLQLLGEVEVARHAVQVLHQNVRAQYVRARQYRRFVWRLVAPCFLVMLVLITLLLIKPR